MQTYFLSIATEEWTMADTKLLKCISPERQEKISKYIHISDKKLSLYAGLVIRMQLSLMTNIPASNLKFYFKPNHKPICLTIPEIDFSLSHTKNSILCCLSPNTTVGADVERIGHAPFEIMNTVFHPEEIAYINKAATKQRDLRFFEIWTRKESYTKQLGTGLVYDLSGCNTFNYSSSLYTWQENDYCCSICGNFSIPPQITSLTEKKVQNYFIDF